MPSHPLSTILTYTTPGRRFIKCPVCSQAFSLPTGRVPGGALATTAKLRRRLGEHMRAEHTFPPPKDVIVKGIDAKTT